MANIHLAALRRTLIRTSTLFAPALFAAAKSNLESSALSLSVEKAERERKEASAPQSRFLTWHSAAQSESRDISPSCFFLNIVCKLLSTSISATHAARDKGRRARAIRRDAQSIKHQTKWEKILSFAQIVLSALLMVGKAHETHGEVLRWEHHSPSAGCVGER